MGSKPSRSRSVRPCRDTFLYSASGSGKSSSTPAQKNLVYMSICQDALDGEDATSSTETVGSMLHALVHHMSKVGAPHVAQPLRMRTRRHSTNARCDGDRLADNLKDTLTVTVNGSMKSVRTIVDGKAGDQSQQHELGVALQGRRVEPVRARLLCAETQRYQHVGQDGHNPKHRVQLHLWPVPRNARTIPGSRRKSVCVDHGTI